MHHRLIVLFVIALALVVFGCSQEGTEPAAEVAQETQQAAETEQAEPAPAEVTLAELATNTAEHVGQTVAVTATVDHVCKHGGKRMFLIDGTPDHRFKITAGDAVGAFDVALEGSDVQVVGVVAEQRIDEAYLDAWEAESSEQKPEVAHEGHEHTAEGAEADHHEEDTQQQIDAMRQRLADSGQDHLSFYSLECLSFEEVEPTV
jgi:hypothetical protein